MSRDKFTILLVVIPSIFVLALCQNNAPLVWTEYNGIDSIAVDRYGTLYVSVPKENKIYELDSRDGSLLPYAGTGEAGFQDGEMYTTATFNGPTGMVIDNQNSVIYLCDTNNNAIRKIVAGMVHTIATNITSPISISIVNYNDDRYRYGHQEFVPNSPIGLYVLSEDGTVTIIEEGPSNDNCAAATALGTPTSNIYVVGSLSNANYETGFYPCYHTHGRNEPQFPEFTVWYSFIGTGDRLNVTLTQQSAYSVNPNLFLYRMAIPSSDASCDSLQCISWEYSQYFYPSQIVEGTITFCSQPEYVYYVAVSSNQYIGENSYNQPIFDLAIVNLGSYGCDQCFCNVSECSTNQCGGYCPDAPQCQGENENCIFGTCFDRTPNANCNNAVALVGNTSAHGNTIKGVGPLMNIDWSGNNCINIRNYGLWYKSVGTGLLTSLDTCNSNSGSTGLHLYLADDSVPCSTSLECVTNGEYCHNGAILYFCGIPDATYYIYVEASNTVADFVLTQTVYENQECTPGNSYNLDSSFYFGYFTSFTSFTSYIYW